MNITPVGSGRIDAIREHISKGGYVVVGLCRRPLQITLPTLISADGRGYRVPAGPRTSKTVYAFAHQVFWDRLADAGSAPGDAAAGVEPDAIDSATGEAPKPVTELTEIGEQFVIPGCEKDATVGPQQGSLW